MIRNKTQKYFLFLLLWPLSLGLISAQVREEWVTSNSFGDVGDKATAMALDAGGNVYVTGESMRPGNASDYATAKYDQTGNLVWIKKYNGSASGQNKATALALDADGNVYITGESWNGTDSDYATIKYDSDGNQLWVARYDGPGHGVDWAVAIAVGNTGNIYVTGRSQGLVGFLNYTTIKYDTDGNQLWVASYSGPTYSDYAYALAVDAYDNIYVTGSSGGGPLTGFDYATVKYDTDGNQLWVARYNGPGNNTDIASAIVLDAEGNVYVTGASTGRRTFDYATIKYDAAGNQLWVARYGTSGFFSNSGATALALDADGNVYVTGGSQPGDGPSYDYATVKYDALGNQLWAVRYAGFGTDYAAGATAIALDGNSNVYVTGSVGSPRTWSADYATIQYNAAGNQIWAIRYRGPTDGENRGKAIALDAAGNVYVTGYSCRPNCIYATIKYSQ